MTVRCCGKDRSTAFCPDCGERLGAKPPILQLLGHLKKMVARDKAKIKNAEDRVARLVESNHPRVDYRKKLLAESRKTLENHKSWYEALENLLNGQGVLDSAE